MIYPRILKTILLFTIGYTAVAQKQCNYTIDTSRVLLNQDLDEFLVKLKNDRFVIYNRKENIPEFIRYQLDCLTGDFSIANPGLDYRCCCTSSSKLPARQLLYLAQSKDVLIMTYLTGGIAVSTHLLFIKVSDNKILNLWTGVSFPALKSKKDIIDYIKKHRYDKWGLNTNIIYL